MEDLGVPRLVPVVELEPNRARELVHELLWIHELQRSHALLEEFGRLVEKPDVGLDLAGSRRALNLDDDFLPVRKNSAMHLPDRRRRDRRRVELEKGPVDGEAELGLYDLLYLVKRNRRHVVL